MMWDLLTIKELIQNRIYLLFFEVFTIKVNTLLHSFEPLCKTIIPVWSWQCPSSMWLALSWCSRMRRFLLVFRNSLITSGKQTVVYQSVLTDRLSSRAIGAICPHLATKLATIFLETLREQITFVGLASS